MIVETKQVPVVQILTLTIIYLSIYLKVIYVFMSLCQPATLIIISGQPLPLTEKPGDTPFTNQSPPLRTTAALPLKRSTVEGKTASSQHEPQTCHTPAAAVAVCA